MPGIRWGKFSGRSRGAGHGVKGRKCEKLDNKDGTKCKENESSRKKGFWHNRGMKNPVADISFDITRPNPESKSSPAVESRVDANFSSLTMEVQNNPVFGCNALQDAEMKKIVECFEDVKQSVHMSVNGIVEKRVFDDAELSTDEGSMCLANVWMDSISWERKIRVNEACNSTIASTKEDFAEAARDERVKHEEAIASYDEAGDKAFLQGLDNKVVLNAGLDGGEIQEVDCPVHQAGRQKTGALLTKNSDTSLRRVPHDFMCGLSKRVMEDPVVVASGQTFERASIQAWLDKGNTHCPVTCKALSHFQLIPNLTLKILISSWFSSKSHDSDFKAAEDSFSSCMSSFSSCPSLMTSSDQDFVSCSSFSVSKLLEGMELNSFSSSSSSPLPKLPMGAKAYSFSSSSTSASSSSSTEQLRERHILNGSCSTGSSSCWEQELCLSEEIESLDDISSANSTQGEGRLVLSKKDCSLHHKFQDVILLPSKPSAYTVSRIESLVFDLKSDYLDIQRNAAAELRLIAKHEDSNRTLITSAGAVKPLIALLRSVDESIQLDATTALLNLSLNHALKEHLVKEGAGEGLVGILRDGLNEVVKENAAVALAHLAACEANRSKIGSTGAIMLLMGLLERGSVRGKKDAAAALYRLSSIDENKRRMIRAGAVRLLVGFMLNDGDKEVMVDKAMAILRNLVSLEEGRVALVEEGGIMSLLQIIEVGSQRSRGLAVPILLQLCTHSSEHRSLVLQKEPLPTLMSISSKTANLRLKTQVAEMIEALIVDP